MSNHKKISFFTAVFLILFFSLMSLAWGGTFYVSPNGSNSNSGTRESPWATPGYGSRQLGPGDTLIILSGKYVLQQYDDDIISPPSGSENAWIVIKGEDGSRPVLAGRENLLTAINLQGVSYVRIENLEITHDSSVSGNALFFRDGIQISGNPSSHIILKDLYIHHIDEFGMNIQDVDDLQIINCRIQYCGFGALGGPAGEHGGWRNVKIQGCSLSYSGHYYQGGDGSNRPYDRPDGFGIEPSSGPILIENTIAEHNYGDGLDSKAENTVIKNCIVSNNSCDGVKLWGSGSRVENTLIYGRGDGDNTTTPWAPIVINQLEKANATFEIVNVTVDDEIGNNYLMYAQYSSNIPIKILIRNTIFSGRGPRSQIYIGNSVTLSADHNLFYLPQSERALEHGSKIYTQANIGELGEGNSYGDPLFILTAWGSQGNYHLRDGSPAIDSGTSNSAPTVDLDGISRPQGQGFDIGAYEKHLTSDQYILTVTKSGTGSGTVTSSPSGINCGTDCNESYVSGTAVTLTATPALGSTFTGWGGACSGTGTCTVTMDSSKSVTATFDLSCISSIDPTSASYPSSSSTGSITVTADSSCPWTATSNNSWITINSGSTGTDSGTVSYTVAQNTSGKRTGTITVQGSTNSATHTVTQTDTVFADVDTSMWSANYIVALRNKSITQGCIQQPILFYCPYDTVTRGQMAAFISRAFLGMQ